MGTLEVSNSGMIKIPYFQQLVLGGKSTPISLIVVVFGLGGGGDPFTVHAICISEALNPLMSHLERIQQPIMIISHKEIQEIETIWFLTTSWFDVKCMLAQLTDPTHRLHIWSDESEALRFHHCTCWWMTATLGCAAHLCMAGSCIPIREDAIETQALNQQLFKKW